MKTRDCPGAHSEKIAEEGQRDTCPVIVGAMGASASLDSGNCCPNPGTHICGQCIYVGNVTESLHQDLNIDISLAEMLLLKADRHTNTSCVFEAEVCLGRGKTAATCFVFSPFFIIPPLSPCILCSLSSLPSLSRGMNVLGDKTVWTMWFGRILK